MSKILKRLIWVLIVLLLLAGGIYIAGKKVASDLEEKWTNKTVPLGTIAKARFSSIDLRPLLGQIIVGNVSLPDSLNNAITGSIDHVKINGVNWPVILVRGREAIRIRDIHLIGIEGRIYPGLINPEKDTASFEVSAHDADSSVIIFSGQDIDIDFNWGLKPRISAFRINDIEYLPATGLYDFKAGSIEANDDGEAIVIDSFRVLPRYSEEDFGWKMGFRAGRMDGIVGEIEIHGLDFEQLFLKSRFSIEQITLTNPVLKVFTNKEVPLQEDRYDPLPHEALLHSPRKFNIKQVDVKSGHVKYASANPETQRRGHLDFQDIYVTIKNITNMENRIDERPVMEVDLSAKVLSGADLEASFMFPLDRDDYRFTWSGRLSQARMESANTFIEPVIDFRVKNGVARHMKFAFASDSLKSVGEMELNYVGLRAEALDPRSHQSRRVISWIANNIVLYPDNVPSSTRYRIVRVDYEREVHRGFPHYIWTSMEHGIINTVLPESLATRLTGDEPLE